MRKDKIVLLSGGNSPEREISLKSSEQIKQGLEILNYEVIVLDPSDFSSYCELINKIKFISPYIVFIGLHGAEGEDGRLQAMLELEKIPFTGSNYLSSALAMNKYLSTCIAQQLNIPTPKQKLIKIGDFAIQNFYEEFKFPIVLKPNDAGSSIFTYVVSSKDELEEKLITIKEHFSEILVNQFVPGRELTVSILDNAPLPVVEIIPKDGWYDFINKYTSGNTNYEVPAKLSSSEKTKVQTYALKIYNQLQCSVYARVDFRFDGKEFFFLEVNTLPGMTPLSLTPMAAKEAGITFEDLLKKIITTSKNKFI